MSMPEYDERQPWQQNIDDLASKLGSILRERSSHGVTVPYGTTNGPGMAQVNADAMRRFDAEQKILEAQVTAAQRGHFWHDEESRRNPVVALNSKLQRWVSEARKRGRLVAPDELAPEEARDSQQPKPVGTTVPSERVARPPDEARDSQQPKPVDPPRGKRLGSGLEF